MIDYLIHCIGDSHVSFFSGQNRSIPKWPNRVISHIPNFIPYKIGPSIAYNLCKTSTHTQGREKTFKILNTIEKNSNVMFSFGEIDCRAHLLRQSELQNRYIEDLVKECVERYCKFLIEIKNLSYSVFVWNVVPSSIQNELKNTAWPVYGSCHQRNTITIMFNAFLKQACQENNFKFVSIFDHLIDHNGLTKKEYFFDDVHLSQKAMPFATEELKKYFLS